MKYGFTSFLMLATALLSHAQVPEKGPLKLQSSAIHLCVTRDAQLVAATRMGEVAKADSLGSYWKRIDPVKTHIGSGTLFDRVNFFNKDTGLVAGFINNKGNYDILYRTTDGGESWQSVNFGQSGWVDDAVHLDNGIAWLSVAGSGLAYTEDYGHTWRAIDIPERRQRFTSIFFNKAKEGIIGSLWNMLAFTLDNGATWRLLPTPLDQSKYQKTNTQSRPEFRKVAIYDRYLLAEQEDLVFYTRKDSINWVLLPNYNAFYTDAENSALYFQTPAGEFVRAGAELQPLHNYGKQSPLLVAICRNGSLYILNLKEVIELKPDFTTTHAPLLTRQPSAMEPKPFGYSQSSTLGIIENKIYEQSGYGAKWGYLFTLPFPSDSGQLSLTADNQILFSRNDDSLFYYDLDGHEHERTTEAALLRNFASRGISMITFAQGSSGCFHNYSTKLIYRYRKGQYEAEEEIPSRTSLELPAYEASIDEVLVNTFVRKLPFLFDSSHNASIEDLDFSESDYEQCKKDILAFKEATGKKKKAASFYFNRNNIDFDRLLHLADSVKHLNRKALTTLFLQGDGFWSTTSNWTLIELINYAGETLSIRSTHFTPGAFYFPWVVTLKGHTTATTCIEINRFINSAYPLFLGRQSKVPVLHNLVKAHY